MQAPLEQASSASALSGGVHLSVYMWKSPTTSLERFPLASTAVPGGQVGHKTHLNIPPVTL